MEPSLPTSNHDTHLLEEVDRDLTLIQKTEVMVKLGSAVGLLTYISGYLIVSTYLGSFGISADASDFLRPKYLYVGFLYMLFPLAMAMIFASVKSFLGLRKGIGVLVYTLKERKRISSRYKDIRRLSFWLWTVIGAVFVLSVTAQITFLRPQMIKQYLFFQFGALGFFLLYQVSYLRSYFNDDWDRASSAIFRLRIYFGIMMALFACCIILSNFGIDVFLSLRPYYLHLWWLKLSAFAAVMLAVVQPLFYRTIAIKRITMQPSHSTIHRWKRRKTWRPWFHRHIHRFGRFRIIAGCLALMVVLFLAGYPAKQFKYKWLVIEWANLIMAMAIIGCVVVNSLRANHVRDESDEEGGFTESEKLFARIIRWILRVATVVSLYIGTTLGYSYCVFARIPVEKFGGNYSTASPVTVHFHNFNYDDGADYRFLNIRQFDDYRNSGTGSGICDPVKQPECQDLILLEETQETAYFASARDMRGHDPRTGGTPSLDLCGPIEWRDTIYERERDLYRPQVLAINRRLISSLEDQPSIQQECEGHKGK